MIVNTQLDLENDTVLISLISEENIMRISFNLQDATNNLNNFSGIADNFVAKRALEWLSSLFGIQLTFMKRGR